MSIGTYLKGPLYIGAMAGAIYGWRADKLWVVFLGIASLIAAWLVLGWLDDDDDNDASFWDLCDGDGADSSD